MTTQEKKEYVIAHCVEMTLDELADACGCAKENVFRILKQAGLRAITKHERKVNIIRQYNGTKTAEQLAELIGCCRMQIYNICKDYRIHYLAEEIHPPQYVYKEKSPPPPSRHDILESHIAKHMSRGFTRLQAIQIIEEVGEWLINLKDDTKPIIRPKGNYANPPTGEGLIDKILNS